MVRMDPTDERLERFDLDRYEWADLPMREQDVENSDLARYRTIGSPSVLHVRVDTNRCIMSNLVWSVGESPEIAKVISPGSSSRSQISHDDLMQKPFMIEANNDATKGNDDIEIEFDHASMACDNQVAISDSRKIKRNCATVLNILRTIKAMTRMYPTLHNTAADSDNHCRTQQENFVSLAKVGDKKWKVKSSSSRRR